MSIHLATPSTNPSLTPDMVQQMIINAFSALGISGKCPSLWYLDSGASNHMTFSPELFSHSHKYSFNLEVHTADGEKLPITVVGDISLPLPLTNVFLPPS